MDKALLELNKISSKDKSYDLAKRKYAEAGAGTIWAVKRDKVK